MKKWFVLVFVSAAVWATAACGGYSPEQALPESKVIDSAEEQKSGVAQSTDTPTPEPAVYEKYQASFTELFDTHTTFIGFTQTEDEYDLYLNMIYDKMEELNNLFDIYNDYPGLNNLKTVNDNAGIAPVVVDQEIINLVLIGKMAYDETNGMVNIAMGPVLRLWHDARTEAKANPAAAYLPSMDLLQEAAQNTDIRNVIVDEEAKTVYLANKAMALDVGALAKGYAVQAAVADARAAGMVSGILNAGGNVVTIGRPMDNRARWGVGIQDPHLDSGDLSNLADTIFTNDLAVVTSGNYQRFFTVDGKQYNHIIDPTTLMPAERFAAVSVMHTDSAIADALSTALFILPKEEGEALLGKWNAQALWIFHDGSTEATAGYQAISKNFSGYSSVD